MRCQAVLPPVPNTHFRLQTPAQGSAPGRAVLGEGGTSSWPVRKILREAVAVSTGPLSKLFSKRAFSCIADRGGSAAEQQ